MENRWLSALIKTVVFLVVAHIVFLILGFFFKTDIGIFNLPMIWAHWSDNYTDLTIGIVATIVVYFIIYFLFTNNDHTIIEDNH